MPDYHRASGMERRLFKYSSNYNEMKKMMAIREELFTAERQREICWKLITKFLILSPTDLEQVDYIGNVLLIIKNN